MADEFQSRPGVDVLVVDDGDSVRSSFAEILRGSGFSVEVAGDGDAALELLDHLDVGIVLLDIRMPRRDGLSVLEELEGRPPVILISAYTMDREMKDRVGSKVVDYLQKPVSPHLLPTVAQESFGGACLNLDGQSHCGFLEW